MLGVNLAYLLEIFLFLQNIPKKDEIFEKLSLEFRLN